MNAWTQLVRGEAPVDHPVPRPAKAIAPRYAGLHKYLDNRHAGVVVLTFGEIEDLLGFALPDDARTDRRWWIATDTRTAGAQVQAWLAADRSAVPNLVSRTVVFERGSAGR